MYIDVSLDRADEDTGLSKRRKLLYLTWKLFARRTLPLSARLWRHAWNDKL